MKILMINKFLHPNGGSETYIFRLGAYLQSQGHEVQYFGMEHAGRCVGNRVDAYTEDMDFHGGSKLAKLLYPVKTIYSSDARKKLRQVLEDFQPDVCHLNNFNFQLTPSILLELRNWKKEGHSCRVVYTAHDYQLVCPDHLCRNPVTGENCEKCLGGHFEHCLKGRCIHGSRAKSLIGMLEARIWNGNRVYENIDTILCCSEFMKTKLDTSPVLASKTVTLHNFVEDIPWKETKKKDYVLYFGRFSQEKGVETLIEACKALPQIPFVFAGVGPLEDLLNQAPNIQNMGFLQGSALETVVRQARFSVCPSECYENCPFSVIESQQCGTPVVGARIGGIPELIQEGKTGLLFESGDADQLRKAILGLWESPAVLDRMSENCRSLPFDTLPVYYRKLMKIYRGSTDKPSQEENIHG